MLGFIGANLTRAALDKNWEVYGVDLPDAENDSLAALQVDLGPRLLRIPVQDKNLAMAFQSIKPDLAVHLAAEAIVGESEFRPMHTFETNVMGTVNVLELCKKRKIPCIVASSDKAYGNGRIPFIETDPLRPQWPYDTSKAVQDLVARSYFETYEMPILVTRGVNTYGLGDLNWSRLVPHTIRAALREERPRNHRAMWTVKREWIYIDDLVGAYTLLASRIVDSGAEFTRQLAGVVNIGSGRVASPSEIVPRILRLTGASVEPILEDVLYHELKDEAVDSSRLRQLGWKPGWELDEGLDLTVRWYRKYLAEGTT